ncbi:LytR/AlgR family response regulator transcription factor [Chitinophaga sp. 22620]|uniref:LytR/AlgR family response regulator transcription factor n=1 Tax=Chitinophaga sp. 22620 TaxID=3453952 RepID=UPI003F86FBFB
MKPEIKALIIDDEAMACDMLAYLIRRHVPAITEVKKCTSAKEGIQLIAAWQPDLLFLDVQMPFMDGFDLLNVAGQHSFSVIFTTAYNKYAIRAIRHSALDYLLKPVDVEEVKQAVERFLRNRQKEGRIAERYQNAVQQLHGEKQPPKLTLLTPAGIRLVKPEDIIYCTGINNYTQFYLRDETVITVSKTLKEFEGLLGEYGFMRIHKSFLVNLDCVMGTEGSESLVMINGSRLNIARRRHREVMKALKDRG